MTIASSGSSVSTKAPEGNSGASGLATPDFTAIKARQQATWSSGDFSVVAARIVYQAEHLCEFADLQAGWTVLDIATGSGNAALAAARRGCTVVGLDYVPSLLHRARIRAAAEHLHAEFIEGDAENLPFPDEAFDAVTSIYGIMFAPNHERAAQEALRVCKPGGRIALASWTMDGFIGETFRTYAKYFPPAPGAPALTPPMRWGHEDHLRKLFGDAARSIRVEARTATFRFRSAEENVAFFRTHYGPTLKAFEALDADGKLALEADLISLSKKYDRNHTREAGRGPIAIEAAYTESLIVKA